MRAPTFRLLVAGMASPLLAGVFGPIVKDDPTNRPPAQASEVSFTWLSNAGWVVEAGQTTLLLDGTVSRQGGPRPDPANPETLFRPPTGPDTASVRLVYEALGLSHGIDVILIGHGHPDHSFDTAVWTRLTGATVIGARSACYQAFAQGLPESECQIVEGGEVIELGPLLRVRVVRWHHAGAPGTPLGRLVQTPLELTTIPTPDAATGALRPSGVQDFPNGGGSRAFLFSYGEPGQALYWLVSDTGNPALFDTPAAGEEDGFTGLGVPMDNLEIVDEELSTRDHLERALRAEGSPDVALWIGYWDPGHVAQVIPVLRPRAFIPNHWLGQAFILDGLPRQLDNQRLEDLLQDAGVALLIQTAFGARYRLDGSGVHESPSDALRARLGIGR
jgi:glyoxylase-like metal-dependent hydrolase (beta-lactamase superfamily II)